LVFENKNEKDDFRDKLNLKTIRKTLFYTKNRGAPTQKFAPDNPAPRILTPHNQFNQSH
jgi:hypothetical protein